MWSQTSVMEGAPSPIVSTIKTIWEVIRTTNSIGFPNIMTHSIKYFPNLCFIRPPPPLSNIKNCPRQNSSIKTWVGFHSCPLMDQGHQLKSLSRAGVEVWQLTPMFPARWRLRKEAWAAPQDDLKNQKLHRTTTNSKLRGEHETIRICSGKCWWGQHA